MKVCGLSHIGLPTRDLEESIRFYEKLGFCQLVRKDNEKGFDYVYLKNGSCVIGLPHAADASGNAPRPSKGAIDHLALSCEDIEGLYEACVKDGMKILSKGIESNDIWQPLECRCFMVEAPDGVRLEFQEMKERQNEA